MVSAIKSSLKHIDFQLDVIHQSLTDELKSSDLQKSGIHQTLSDEFKTIDYQYKTIRQTLSDEFKKALIQPEKLLVNLSYSHFSELMTITDIHKRTFFEMETIKGGWKALLVLRDHYIDEVCSMRRGLGPVTYAELVKLRGY